MSGDAFEESMRDAAKRALIDALRPPADGEESSDSRREGEGSRDGEDDVAETAPTPPSGAGRAFIERMADSGNQVMQNPFGEPVVEIITPIAAKEQVETEIVEWDLNPRGHGVMAQAPSFADERPEVGDALVAWQFMLAEGEEDDLKSSGFDVGAIVDALDDVPVLMTKANRVKASLPVE